VQNLYTGRYRILLRDIEEEDILCARLRSLNVVKTAFSSVDLQV
jgi:hypothetical protein